MTLRKLTLSISLLAASLMLAAPAQAETWTCSVIYKTEPPETRKHVFVRKGDVFRYNFMDYQIVDETDDLISLHHLLRRGTFKINPTVVVIWKNLSTFTQIKLLSLGGIYKKNGKCVRS